MRMCRHCNRRKANKCRGLCFSCYFKPGVRERYPSESKFGQWGIGHSTPAARADFAPTKTPPGTETRVAVYATRAVMRLPIFHPNDLAGDFEAVRPLSNR